MIKVEDANNAEKSVESFFKFAPLLDPTKYMAGKYKDISKNEGSILPDISENSIYKRINCVDNASYVDGFFSYLSSKLLHEYGFIHGLDFYGSYLGIKEKFKYDITDDLEYLYDYEYFHKNKDILFKTEIIHEDLMDNDTRKNRKSIKIGEIEEIKVEDIDNDIFKGVFEELTTENIEQHNKFLDDIKISNIDYFREEK